MKLTELHCWRDLDFRSASSNMALGEALFFWSVQSGLAAARFYHWDRPAATIGYSQGGRDGRHSSAVRRYTGGGLVEHGEDLTFVLAFPAGAKVSLLPAFARYRCIHEALAEGLSREGFRVSLEKPDAVSAKGPCFEHAVPWDLLDPVSWGKIGGGAQRRSRGAVIHQGSLRLPEALRYPESAWISHFLAILAETVIPLANETRDRLLADSLAREAKRYGNEDWNGTA